jgi:DNA (cytosine-5)-methyltransferase 1
VDLFAGAGGTTLGATLAGVRVLAAVNHWPVAVATHRAAHPETEHRCEDAAVLDPTTLPAHDLLLASPSCTGHTRARGTDRPHHDAARATAWCVLRVAEAQRPRAVVVENVPDFLRWVCYRAWRLALTDLGYRISEQILDAADAGVPQHRRRLFVVAVRSHRPVAVPAPAHPHVSARSVLSLDTGPWSRWSTWSAASRARVTSAQSVHGTDVLVPYYGSASAARGWSLDRPIGTLTTVDRYALVRADLGRMLTPVEMLRLSGFPTDYPLQGTRRERVMQIGNAVPPPLARWVVERVMEAA